MLECERHYGYSTSCKTQRQLIKSSNLKGHPVVQHVPIQRGVKELHRLLLVLHLLERGYITHPSGGREGFTYMMIVCEIFDFSREVPSVGEGGNAPNRKFFLQCGYGIHLRYTVEKCEFCTSHARLHRSKQLFYG